MICGKQWWPTRSSRSCASLQSPFSVPHCHLTHLQQEKDSEINIWFWLFKPTYTHHTREIEWCSDALSVLGPRVQLGWGKKASILSCRAQPKRLATFDDRGHRRSNGFGISATVEGVITENHHRYMYSVSLKAAEKSLCTHLPCVCPLPYFFLNFEDILLVLPAISRD